MRYLRGCLLIVCVLFAGCGQGDKNMPDNSSLAEAAAKQIYPQDEANV